VRTSGAQQCRGASEVLGAWHGGGHESLRHMAEHQENRNQG
jgi:hypothetical protein